ncbi:iron-sulfur cluster biosynthesis family protein [Aquirufa sp. A-Brett2-15D]
MLIDTPVHLTDSALENLRLITFPEPFLRIGMRGGTCGGTYVLGFDSKTANDEEYLIENIPVIIDRRELLFVLGTEISFEAQGNGFFLHKPAKS